MHYRFGHDRSWHSHRQPFTNMLVQKPKADWRMGATSEGIGLVAQFN
ncbi:MAG: hypothetical protein QM610_14315 [Chitinophagaceae bacterium]